MEKKKGTQRPRGEHETGGSKKKGETKGSVRQGGEKLRKKQKAKGWQGRPVGQKKKKNREKKGKIPTVGSIKLRIVNKKKKKNKPSIVGANGRGVWETGATERGGKKGERGGGGTIESRPFQQN